MTIHTPAELVYEWNGSVRIQWDDANSYTCIALTLSNEDQLETINTDKIDCLVIAIDQDSYTTEHVQSMITTLEPTYTVPRIEGDTRAGYQFLQMVARDCLSTRKTTPKVLLKWQCIPLHH